MKVKSLIFLSLLTLGFPSSGWCQFNTIQRDNKRTGSSSASSPVVSNSSSTVLAQDDENYFYAGQDSILKAQQKRKLAAQEKDFFKSADGHEVSIERDIPVFVNMRDSLLFGLINERMDFCLPLDYISVSSRYGMRHDPFSKCTKFHDGIDLQCNLQNVYSMLPGKVVKVHFGNKGYGNYVVCDYGHIQCLYGHLQYIAVNQGDDVYAGTILGISGNSGRSTAPHLHLKITAGKKSLDPAPFISYLNRYITSLQDKIAYLRFGTKPPRELNIASLYEALDRYGVMYPKIVVAQSLLETGYFSSNVCLNYNNLFGLRRPSDGSYYRFDNWEESVKAYKDYVQYKYKGGDYLQFLSRIGYAEDPAYIYKVRSISNALSYTPKTFKFSLVKH